MKNIQFPRNDVSIIGADKDKFPVTFFGFCPDCFINTFGQNILFYPDKEKEKYSQCLICESSLYTKLPYAVMAQLYVSKNALIGRYEMDKRRLCHDCTVGDLKTVLSSIAIITV